NRRLPDDVDLAARTIGSQRRFDSGYDPIVMAPLARVEGRSRSFLEGRPDVRRRPKHIREAWRHHTDDEILVVVEHDWPANDRSIASKTTLQQPIADDRDTLSANLIVALVEVATDHRR